MTTKCPLSYILLFYFVIFSITITRAQCPPGFISTSMNSDTVVSGFGTDSYTFSFPQFNPVMGTLLEVRIETFVTLNFSFYAENGNPGPVIRNMRVIRSDDFSSPVLGVQSPVVNNAPNYNSGVFPMAATDGIYHSGPDFHDLPVTSVLNGYARTTAVSDISSFSGTGTVSFDYNSSTFNSLTNGSSSNIEMGNTTDDIIRFRLAYVFCSPVVLPSTIRNFTIRKISDEKALLSWLVSTDLPGKKYSIERSFDGMNFYCCRRDILQFVGERKL